MSHDATNRSPELQQLVRALEVDTGMRVPMPPDQLALALGVDVLEVRGGSGSVRVFPDRGAVLYVDPADPDGNVKVARACAWYLLKCTGMLPTIVVGELWRALCAGADGVPLALFAEPVS